MNKLLGLLIIALACVACTEDPVPKPTAYFRIPFPEKRYAKFDTAACPYQFELPSYAVLKPSPDMGKGDKCWANIYFPRFRGEIYLTYKEITPEVTLEKLLQEMHASAYSHQSVAENITPSADEDSLNRKYWLRYDVEGNVASQTQFCITDNKKHFLRGALYFAAVPNKDSLAPVVDFIRADIDRMIESFRWKE